MKKSILLTTVLYLACATVCTSPTVYADTDDSQFLPDTLYTELTFADLADFVRTDSTYYFAEGNRLIEWENGILSTLYVNKTGSLRFIEFSQTDENILYLQDNADYHLEYNISTGETTTSNYHIAPRESNRIGDYYFKDDVLNYFSLEDGHIYPMTVEGDKLTPYLYQYGGEVYVHSQTAIYSLEKETANQLSMQYYDESKVSGLSLKEIKEGLSTVQDRIATCEVLQSTIVVPVDLKTDATAPTVIPTVSAGQTVLLLYEYKNASLIAFQTKEGGTVKYTTYLIHSDKIGNVTAQPMSDPERATYYINSSVGLYSLPYISDSTFLRTLPAKQTLAGVRKCNGDMLMTDFCYVELADGSKGYVPMAFLSIDAYASDNNTMTEKPDENYSTSNSLLTLGLILLLIFILLTTIFCLICIGVSSSGKKRKSAREDKDAQPTTDDDPPIDL